MKCICKRCSVPPVVANAMTLKYDNNNNDNNAYVCAMAVCAMCNCVCTVCSASSNDGTIVVSASALSLWQACNAGSTQLVQYAIYSLHRRLGVYVPES